MSDAAVSQGQSASQGQTTANRNSIADTFSKSLLLIGFLMVLQRGIGFLRSFYVCGALTPAEVGRWDLAFNFLVIAAPLAVLGIPGSFGRYLARFEIGGQQLRFLRQTIGICLVLAVGASALFWWFDETVARYFFGSIEYASDVRLLALGLPVIIFFNFSTSWFSGKRLNRFVFRIQFAQTLFFAVLCVVGFRLYEVSAAAVIIAYFLSCLMGIVLAASYWLVDRPPHDTTASNGQPEPIRIWHKLLPFAVWVWASNALTNLFSLCDRMLVVNFHPDPNLDIQYVIGQYHTACVFPMLLTTLGAMAASTGMPYLSRDWESGDMEGVGRRMNAMLKAIGMLCLVASVVIMLAAPILFGVIWQDKFALGESLLPLTLCYCSLAALSVVAQNYFWCIEKTWIGTVLLLIGLTVNFGAGVLLIDRYGITGVVASTMVAHAIVLAAVLWFCGRQHLRLDSGVFFIAVAILSITLGKVAAVAALLIVIAVSLRTTIVIDQPTKALISEKLHRLRRSCSA